MTSRALSNGREAVVKHESDGASLWVGGFAQSHVGAPGARPKHTVMRWMAAAALEALEGRTDATALHIGGGAATLPRLLQHELPGMRQRVIELEPAIVELAHAMGSLPAGIELVVGDGRAALEAARQPVSLVTIDVFDGGRLPAAFTSVECFSAARAALEPAGLLIVNSADGPPLHQLRAQLATLAAVFAHVAIITRGSTLAIRDGNIVLLASDAELPLSAIRELVRHDAPPAVVVGGARLARFVADTAPAPITDATAVDHAEPVLSRHAAPGELPSSLMDPIAD